MFRARKKIKKIFLGPFDQIGPQFGPKRVILVQNFQKNEKFSKIFFFDLNDSESKKGQKNDEKFFSLLSWSVIFGQKCEF